MRSLAALLAVAAVTAAAAGTIPDEDWGYIDPRPGTHLFWWLYGSTGETPREDAPLVMWLQGGPGASSTGYGNFEEMGPLDTSFQPRNTTWVKQANILYLDQPVGTGYSYVDSLELLTTNNTQIANDMVAFLQAFLQRYPNFKKQRFYVFCESYGGKMTTGLATALLNAIDNKALTLDFRGVALGDSWIDPLAFTLGWPEYLRQLSLLDPPQAKAIYGTATGAAKAAAAGNWTGATDVWGQVEDEIEAQAGGVSFYNFRIMGPSQNTATPAYRAGTAWSRPSIERLAARHLDVFHEFDLAALMNGPVRAKLGSIPANVTWGGQAGDVFNALSGDFMKPVYEEVSALISSGRLHVTVYEGQLDVICMTSGAEEWISKMGWGGLPAFYAAPKEAVSPWAGAPIGAFHKTHGAFSMWWIMEAGHMVPKDNGQMAYAMVQHLLAQ